MAEQIYGRALDVADAIKEVSNQIQETCKQELAPPSSLRVGVH
jgi:hypothetical protein